METTYPCDTCKKLGRVEAMMRYEYTVDNNTVTFLWHQPCLEPYEVSVLKRWKARADFEERANFVQVSPISNVPAQPAPRQMELASELERDRAVVDTQAELAKARKRIQALEADLATIQAGKEAAERMLRAEQAACVALARHGTLQLDRNWLELANEMAMLKGQPGLQAINGEITRMTSALVNPNEPFFTTQGELDAYRETLVIDFMNRFRRGAFAEIEKDNDEIIVVKAQAYDQAYKVCCEILSMRNVKLKIARNAEYKIEQANAKEARVEVERKKSEPKTSSGSSTPKRATTPEDIIMQNMLKLCRGDEKAAREMYDSLMAKKAPAPVGAKK